MNIHESTERPPRPARFILECEHELEFPDYPGDPSYIYCYECERFRRVVKIRALVPIPLPVGVP